MSNTTETIKIEPEVKEKLKNLKRYQRETWNEVIKRVVDKYSEGE